MVHIQAACASFLRPGSSGGARGRQESPAGEAEICDWKHGMQFYIRTGIPDDRVYASRPESFAGTTAAPCNRLARSDEVLLWELGGVHLTEQPPLYSGQSQISRGNGSVWDENRLRDLMQRICLQYRQPGLRRIAGARGPDGSPDRRYERRFGDGVKDRGNRKKEILNTQVRRR